MQENQATLNKQPRGYIKPCGVRQNGCSLLFHAFSINQPVCWNVTRVLITALLLEKN